PKGMAPIVMANLKGAASMGQRRHHRGFGGKMTGNHGPIRIEDGIGHGRSVASDTILPRLSIVLRPVNKVATRQEFGTEGIAPMERTSLATRFFMKVVAWAEKLNLSFAR